MGAIKRYGAPNMGLIKTHKFSNGSHTHSNEDTKKLFYKKLSFDIIIWEYEEKKLKRI